MKIRITEAAAMALLLIGGCASASREQPSAPESWDPPANVRPLADWVRPDVRPPEMRAPLSSTFADQIYFTVRNQNRALQRCYQGSLKNDPALYGELSVTFEVAEDGRVQSPRVDFTTMGSPAIEPCILKFFEELVVPTPPKPGMKVRYPMVFTSAATPPLVMTALAERYHLERVEEKTVEKQEDKNDYKAPW